MTPIEHNVDGLSFEIRKEIKGSDFEYCVFHNGKKTSFSLPAQDVDTLPENTSIELLKCELDRCAAEYEIFKEGPESKPKYVAGVRGEFSAIFQAESLNGQLTDAERDLGYSHSYKPRTSP